MSKAFEKSEIDDLSIKIRHIVSAELQAGSIYRLADIAELEISSKLGHLVTRIMEKLRGSGQP
jgi:hypothetical protein